jgi:hypothetical protein
MDKDPKKSIRWSETQQESHPQPKVMKEKTNKSKRQHQQTKQKLTDSICLIHSFRW